MMFESIDYVSSIENIPKSGEMAILFFGAKKQQKIRKGEVQKIRAQKTQKKHVRKRRESVFVISLAYVYLSSMSRGVRAPENFVRVCACVCLLRSS